MTDQPNNDTHTPGPLKLGYMSGRCHIDHGTKYHPGPPDCVYEPEFNSHEDGEEIEGIVSESQAVNVFAFAESEPPRPLDARLAMAAYNQFDKHFGPSAVSAAEGDALGELKTAMEDMLSGWKYIRDVHGDLPGVGWDRAQAKAEKALAKTSPNTAATRQED